MLANGKDKGIIDGQPGTLRLHDIKVMPLGMRRGMAQDKFVWRVLSGVEDWKGQCQWMRNIAAGMHEPLLTSIYLQYTLTLIAWQHSLDSNPLLAAVPVRLDKRSFAHNVTTLKEITIGIASECR
jgi:hypothetical protein